ncbi:uncharacterized protein LAESUDRAFT_656853 [Laetiporus sulphureus 93-53]|uniref:BTB domain-containing protein n=1 Tax=Laetiporus sulphureus 93-53 TaxID=1314785 RepID=A0A165DJ65_9APHY|nr:uncharacterized protein LAESUDRAFT_656853 [Laetiporus sulphureus 93-53]KZT04999.1 hypothetical protein LAESUDRAFT_656853 [Laetiporus sulphureus 93-53]
MCTESTLVRALPGPDPPSKHHYSFYFQDGLVILNVKGSLYRVHRHLLEHNSEYFRELLSPGNSSIGPSGATDDTAISIPDLTSDEFDCLLNFLYYRVYEDSTLSVTEWITLLDVSTRLRFTTIRTLSIRALSAQRSSLSAVETIVLAIKHDVPSWLAPAYAELCRRPHPLDDGEAEQLGAKIAARVGRARETIRDETFRAHQEKQYGIRYAPPEAFDEELVNTTVSETFWVGDASNPSRS